MLLGPLLKRGPVQSDHSGNHAAVEPVQLAAPGPWGTLEYVPMVIAPPESLLPVRKLENAQVHWLFKGFSRNDMVKFLDGLDLTTRQREQFLSSATLHTVSNGLELTPASDLFFSLKSGARDAIYKCLADFDENIDTELFFIRASTFQEQFRDSGVSAATLSLLRSVSSTYGDYLVFSGVSCLLSKIPSYEEKSHFLKAITRQNTLMLRLHVGPKSDLNALANYWGKACWNTDVKAMLESLARIPGGAAIDIVDLLPPLPGGLIYTYPIPPNPMAAIPTTPETLRASAARRDCLWTALNFFRDPPDDRYSEPNYVQEKLKLDHFPVSGDPRFGDVVLLTKPNGNVVHAAVFIGADFVYTKNGSTDLHPWMLSTISDLVSLYSYYVPPDQKLVVTCFRNKYY